jgi:hypothetical protein
VLGTIEGIGTTLGGILTGNLSMIGEGLKLTLGAALVPRFDFTSGPFWPGSRSVPARATDTGRAALAHDRDIGFVFAPRATPHDARFIGGLWRSPFVGPYEQAYRVLATAGFGLKIGAQEAFGAAGIVR